MVFWNQANSPFVPVAKCKYTREEPVAKYEPRPTVLKCYQSWQFFHVVGKKKMGQKRGRRREKERKKKEGKRRVKERKDRTYILHSKSTSRSVCSTNI